MLEHLDAIEARKQAMRGRAERGESTVTITLFDAATRREIWVEVVLPPGLSHEDAIARHLRPCWYALLNRRDVLRRAYTAVSA